VLLALIDVILVLARQRRFEALAIDEVKLIKVSECSIGADHSTVCGGPDRPRYDTYPEESVVLLPQVNVAIGALTHTGKMDMISLAEKGRTGKKETMGHTTSLKCSQKTASLISTVLSTTSVMATVVAGDGGETVLRWDRLRLKTER
jgi:hypothetical protein